MTFWKGDIVEVRGVSSFGKTRIREHGVIWKVSKVVVGDVLGIMPTGSVLLKPLDDTEYLRWVKPNDGNLEIIRLIDLNNI